MPALSGIILNIICIVCTCRDKTKSTDPDIESRREHFEEMFTILSGLGELFSSLARGKSSVGIIRSMC